VAGRTTADVQDMIVRGLKGKSQSPQAMVSVRSNLSRTVFVAGDVRKPGRFELSLQNERLLDAIALGGGAAYSSEDTLVRFNRGSRTVEERLGRIRAGAADDLVLVAGDRIELIKRPRSFIVLGATTRVSQVPFETGDLSLAEAVARAGGPQDERADPSAVFLFRYDPVQPGSTGAQPVIYKLDMMEPTNYFLAQKFAIRDKDVIYIANAAANRPAKMVNIINQLFSPFVTARVLTQRN
jgi:polysaccharide export outer membrane protein